MGKRPQLVRTLDRSISMKTLSADGVSIIAPTTVKNTYTLQDPVHLHCSTTGRKARLEHESGRRGGGAGVNGRFEIGWRTLAIDRMCKYLLDRLGRCDSHRLRKRYPADLLPDEVPIEGDR